MSGWFPMQSRRPALFCLSRPVRVLLLRVSLGPSRPWESWRVSGIAQAAFSSDGDALESYEVRNQMRTAACLGFGRRGESKSDGGCDRDQLLEGRRGGPPT